MLRKRRHAAIEPNLTSLIDVTFLLIVFFVLVSHLNEIEAVELDLPRPLDPATVQPTGENQVALSVIPGPDGAASGYRVGEEVFSHDDSGRELLAAHLVSLYRLNPQIHINVRADQAARFEHVEPAIRAVSIAAQRVQGDAAPGGTFNPRVNLMVVAE
jgi:biopolymer transport protein ExbD